MQPDPIARVEGNDVIFRLRSSFKITPQIRGGDVIKGLAGTSPEEATSILRKRVKLASPPRIELSPAWFPRLPFFDFRMALFVRAEQPAPAASVSQ